mmetsp:Transcript_71501/g.209578  ORF Transcript_71501/g.209578 Transcript_71501/m.209578 type:complete len:263 (-) Transcript_71501:53-841(-)
MGRHKKIPSRGMSREQKKKKFRPQDPFYRGPRAPMDVRIDRPPGKDEDVLDVPEVSSGANMLGPGLAEEVLFGKPTKQKLPADDGLSGRAKRRQRAKEKRKAAAEGGAVATKKRRRPDGAKADDKSASGPKLPKQLPGESAKSYARRVDAALEGQMAVARRKLVTEHQKEKRKKRDENKKQREDKKKSKKAGAERVPEGAEPGRIERPTFGDVVQRPPVLGPDAMKSMSKLKRPREDTEDLEGYASRVREAYAEMKRRRRAR